MSEECKVKHEQLSSDISVLLERIKNIHDEEVLLRNDLRNNLLDETRFTDELGDLNQKKAKAERKNKPQDLRKRIKAHRIWCAFYLFWQPIYVLKIPLS